MELRFVVLLFFVFDSFYSILFSPSPCGRVCVPKSVVDKILCCHLKNPLPRSYFHDASEQLKTNFHTNFCFKRVLGFVIEYA